MNKEKRSNNLKLEKKKKKKKRSKILKQKKKKKKNPELNVSLNNFQFPSGNPLVSNDNLSIILYANSASKAWNSI